MLKPRQYFFLLILLLTGRAVFAQSSQENYETGKKLKAAGKCQEALVYFRKATEEKSDFGEAYYESGWCYNELNDHGKALEQLRNAAKFLPGDKNVAYETGYAYYNLDSADLALKLYQKVLSMDSAYLLAKLGMGDIFRDKKKDSKEALKWYKEVLAVDRANKKAYYWAGWCCNELRNFSDAVPFLKNVISIDSSYYLGYSELGYAYYSMGNMDEAIPVLKVAQEAQPKIETAAYYLGLCYVKKGQKQEAIKIYNEMVLSGSKLAVNLLPEIQKMPAD